MAFKYDPNDTGFEAPMVGVEVRVIIGQCEETKSNAGNNMLVLNCTVAPEQEGAGFKAKFYAVGFSLGWVMSATGIDPDIPQDVDDMTFRGRDASVVFMPEKWTGDDGEERTSIKLKKWIPRDKATIKLAETPEDAALETAISTPAEPEPVDDSDIPF